MSKRLNARWTRERQNQPAPGAAIEEIAGHESPRPVRRLVAAVAGAIVVATVAGCAGGDSDSTVAPDGEPSPRLPSSLEGLDNAVTTRVRVVTASQLDRVARRLCEKRLAVRLNHATVVVERTGPHGSTWTFLMPGGESVGGCDHPPAPLPDRDRAADDPWCAAAVGTFVSRRLSDPRLNVCETEDGEAVAFVWVEPGPASRWLVVRGDDDMVIYAVTAGLPVRVTTEVEVGASGAAIDVDHHARQGNLIRSSTIHAVISG